MKIVVIGGTGLIGTKVVQRLRAAGHVVIAASPSSGVDTTTGEGVVEALTGAQVVIDLANSPSFEDKAVVGFFQASGLNLLAIEKNLGIGHHVALSVVGTDKLSASGYFRGKIAQEALITASGNPYTIIRSTQFFEFLDGIVKAGADGDTVRFSPAWVQPIASDDVADAVVAVALAEPVNGIVEIAGPEREPLDKLVASYMRSVQDPREVVTDVHARYFGAELQETTLVPEGRARQGRITLNDWMRSPAHRRSA